MAARPGRTWGLTQTQVPTLRAGGINVTSCFDRDAEARLQASRIPAGASEAWIYGLALGDLQRVLLERAELERLHVVVMSRAVARLSLELVPHPWLEDPRVELHLGSAEPAGPREPFACAPACVWMTERDAHGLRDGLMHALARPMIEEDERRQREVIAGALRENADRLAADPDVETLFGRHRDATAFVIGGGPTLDQTLPWLRDRRGSGLVIAVNSGVRPLRDAGVVPDYVVAVDPSPALARHFEGLDADRELRSVPLIYPPGLHPDTLARWPGRFFKTTLSTPAYLELCPDDPRGCLFASGTVLHAAVDLARKLGAARIQLLGADFCFPRGLSHGAGAVDRQRMTGVRVMTTDGRGRSVPTVLNLLGYRDELARYVDAHPELEIVRVGRAGAAMPNVAFLEGGP